MNHDLTPLLACIGAVWLFVRFGMFAERVIERWQLGRHEIKRREPVRVVSPLPSAVAIPTSWRQQRKDVWS